MRRCRSFNWHLTLPSGSAPCCFIQHCWCQWKLYPGFQAWWGLRIVVLSSLGQLRCSWPSTGSAGTVMEGGLVPGMVGALPCSADSLRFRCGAMSHKQQWEWAEGRSWQWDQGCCDLAGEYPDPALIKLWVTSCRLEGRSETLEGCGCGETWRANMRRTVHAQRTRIACPLL